MRNYNNRKYAFTLAEVLITLGIIGVVAAITLPTLIANYQKSVYYNSFLKSMNTIENYVRTMCLQDGIDDISTCNFDQYLGNRRNYTTLSNITVYSYNDIVNNNKIKKCMLLNNRECNDDRNYPIDSGAELLMFADGTSVFWTDYTIGSEYTIDTNSPFKGPNTFGRDMFHFHVFNSDYTKNGIYWAGTNDSPFKVMGDDCKKNSAGNTCAGKLIKEHKMNY